MYNPQNAADRLKKLLTDKRVTGKQMASDLDLGVNTLSNIRRGDVKSVETFIIIADYLGVSVDYLLGRTDDPHGHGSVSIGGDNNNNGTQAINGSVSVTTPEKQPDSLTEQFLQQFDSLSFEDKLTIMQQVQDIKKSAAPKND